jgi:multiple sugar transport system ATP-binding protein
MAEIAIENIEKEFGPVRALEAVSLAVADGEFVSLLGPSGCGKTTLLRIVAGLEAASAGRVLIGGRDVTGLPPRARNLAMVFQNYAVFPHLTVAENIGFGLRMRGAPAAEAGRRVARAAELLRITPFLGRYPAALSGGQRQRVAVARALAVEPAVLLMDEPLSNLDAQLRLEMRGELKSVLREVGTTTLYVTHDQTEAMGLSDRVAVMSAGRVEQVGAPMEIYRAPASVFVGGFVGSPPMNFVPEGDGALLGFRPEDVRLAPEGEDGALPFLVRVAEPMGPHLLLTGVSRGGALVRVAAPSDAAVAPGARLGLLPDPARLVRMDKDSGRRLP